MIKTYLVTSLDTGNAVSVGEAFNDVCARIDAAETNGLNYSNLIAEEVDVNKVIPPREVTY
jgi:hypothetical protein